MKEELYKVKFEKGFKELKLNNSDKYFNFLNKVKEYLWNK